MTFHVPERFRLVKGRLASSSAIGNNGAFIVRLKHCGEFFTIASDGLGWEHISVSRKDRCPTWSEMCAIKNLFWDEEDCVLQFHPPKSEYVNNHPYCLHMWRPIGQEILRPPSIMVGV